MNNPVAYQVYSDSGVNNDSAYQEYRKQDFKTTMFGSSSGRGAPSIRTVFWRRCAAPIVAPQSTWNYNSVGLFLAERALVGSIMTV